MSAVRVNVGVALLIGLLPISASADPRIDYLLHCGGCHLENGAGDPPRVPDLRQFMDGFAALPAGRAYLTRVPGAAQAPISDAKLAEVINWMFASFYPGQALPPFSAEEIGRYRVTPLLDPLAERARLLANGLPEGTLSSSPAEVNAD